MLEEPLEEEVASVLVGGAVVEALEDSLEVEEVVVLRQEVEVLLEEASQGEGVERLRGCFCNGGLAFRALCIMAARTASGIYQKGYGLQSCSNFSCRAA